MNFRAIHTTDAIGRPVVFEEYIGTESLQRMKRLMLPRTNDRDVVVSTKKHGEVSLGNLFLADPAYLEWLVTKSQQTKTIKYAAVRVLCGDPYTVPANGLTYDESLFFDHRNFKKCAEKLNLQIHEK